MKTELLGVKTELLGVKTERLYHALFCEHRAFLLLLCVQGGLMSQEIVVTKGNALVEASYRLSISEQRVLAFAIARIHPDDDDFGICRFKATDLQKLIESANKDEHQRLKALVKDLAERTLQIPRESGGWLVASWLASGEYFPGRGEIELEFSQKLKPYLLLLRERFTSYGIENIVKLRSRYSIRLYELLKQYESIGRRSFELAELRHILGLSDNEFGQWIDFKRFVLERAQRELPKKTDLGFSYTTRKHIRAVAFVDFEIWPVERAPKKAKKKATKKSAEKRPTSPHEKAKQCYREHDWGTSCDVPDIVTLNGLPECRQEICALCANHQHALFENGAA